ncbi:MAG: DUF255 domain-containing protein [Candidatus Lokiarchaeota archaeon]|nr:DUF255 domain-containing protein [Candidatus Lokiarchaeota archaeon]
MSNSEKNKQKNHLAGQTSDYLKQHLYNLVDWYPWGKEAFRKANEENKPIFLSIGYSTCHWCHVMAHESFDDPKIAGYLNDNFVSIKVDREERPDLDQIYQTFIQIIGKHGGWPLSIFLTPQREPFFGGTYFPATPRYGMMDFLEVLKRINEAYHKHKQDISNSISEIMSGMNKVSDISTKISQSKDKILSKLNEEMLDKMSTALMGKFDSIHGGFGSAPKFPNFTLLSFVIRYLSENEEKDHYKILKFNIRKTLDKMMNGGIYDHIGGGFARYSVDQTWTVPHFEKMLYTNALALSTYSEAFLLFQDTKYKNVVKEIVDWLLNEMYVENFGFYSAQDADSEGQEGKFYVWKKHELDSIIPTEDRFLFYQAYNITTAGNFEGGTNILTKSKSNGELANEFDLTPNKVREKLSNIKKILYEERKKRIPPLTDKKILLAWNALTIVGLFDAYKVLKDEDIKVLAHKLLNNLLGKLYDDDKNILYSVYYASKDNRKNYGTLDVYAYIIQALLRDYIFYNNDKTFGVIKKLLKSVEIQFGDTNSRGLFYASSLSKDILVRMKNGADMPLPNGNSVMIANLLEMHYYTTEIHFLEKAEEIMSIFLSDANKLPFNYGMFLKALQWYVHGSTDIAVISKDDSILKEVSTEIFNYYIPRLHLFLGKNASKNLPSFSNKSVIKGDTTYYLCDNFNCLNPIYQKEQFLEILNEKFRKD